MPPRTPDQQFEYLTSLSELRATFVILGASEIPDEELEKMPFGEVLNLLVRNGGKATFRPSSKTIAKMEKNDDGS